MSPQRSARYTITGGTLRLVSPQSEPIKGTLNGHLMLVIENFDPDEYKVWVNKDEVTPYQDAPQHPLQDDDSETVGPFDVEVLRLKIKNNSQFAFKKYKYTIHWQKTGTTMSANIDPDFEIEPVGQ
jgi:hypothetical protein